MNNKYKQGSSLVAALFLGAVLIVSGVAFLQVAGSSSTQEARAFEDVRALYAGESGLNLATRYLRATGTLPAATTTPYQVYSSRLPINGLFVETWVTEVIENADDSRTMDLLAVVYNAATGSTANEFLKRIYWTIDTEVITDYGTFFNSTNCSQNTLWDRVFYGRVHINDKVCIDWDPAHPVIFHDPVSVTGGNWSGNYGIGPSGNDYNDGVRLDNYTGGDIATDLDGIFQSTYEHVEEAISVPLVIGDLIDSLNGYPNRVVLPTSQLTAGYIPSLVFNSDGTATYYYKTGGVQDTTNIGTVNDHAIYSATEIRARGVVVGKTTLYTGAGNIEISGDLIYAAYDTATVSIANDNDALGLVPAEDIYFPNTWDSLGTSIAVDRNGDGKVHVTASCVALVNTTQGTEYWNTGDFYDYGLYFTGLQYLSRYRSATGGGGKGAQYYEFHFDTRYSDGVVPVGFPNLQSANSLWIVRVTNWEEDNVF